MKKNNVWIPLPLLLLLATAAQAQKQVQPLQPVKLSVFKNGTFFVKREAAVTVNNQVFYIPAPQNVLLGTYWLAVGKEAGLHSIAVKPDTFRIQRTMKVKEDYLESSIGKQIVLYRHTANTETVKLAGTLLSYDRISKLLRLKTTDKRTVITNADLYAELEIADGGTEWWTDSVATTAKVVVNKPLGSTTAATISLEKGIQWFPSYLLRIVNDKEARLEMKATLVNSSEHYLNTPVDIIIGNPEMFFGNQLDPACLQYFSEELFSRSSSVSPMQMQAVNNLSGRVGMGDMGSGEADSDGKEGEQFEDLYYYKLGVQNLEKDARVMVPVLSTTVSYQDIYTAELDIHSTGADERKPLEAYHSYRIVNNTAAPLTSGAMLVMNQTEQPVAQSLLHYTPVKGTAEVRLSKALNLQLKNEEAEIKREKVPVSGNYNTFREKIMVRGTIQVVNFQSKKVTVRVGKALEGIVLKMSDNGKAGKITNADEEEDTISRMQWEVELEPGGKKIISYEYYSIK